MPTSPEPRPVDIAALLRALASIRPDAVPDLELLDATRGTDIEPFWSALLADAGAAEGKLRSRPGRSIELYADAVSRHAKSDAIALSTLDVRGTYRHLSFAELDSAATACAAAWSLSGVEPGQLVAITASVGEDWLIAFAAALRLGLTVSVLSSFGPEALQRRLRALEPQRIVCDHGKEPPAEFAERALAVVRSSTGHAPPPRVYAPKHAFAKLFSPLRSPVERPNVLSAETALLFALRDARFAYHLDATAGLAIPGLSVEQHQPAAMLACLLAGARFVELPIPILARHPRQLAESFITTLGVSPALREILRKERVLLSGLRAWWRSVDEPLDWSSWQTTIEQNELGKVPASNLLVDAASGGAVLISAERPGFASAFVVPSPGAPFVLSEPGSGAPSLGSSGVFNAGAKPDPKNPGWFLLGKRGSEHLYGGTLEPRRAGRVFPEDEVVECASKISGVDGACVVPVATGDAALGWSFVLVLFVGALSEPVIDSVCREAETAIRARLGDAFVPDRITAFPLHSRHLDQKLDLAWCRRQYSAGFLSRKVALPVFGYLTRLRASLRMVSDDVR